MKFLFNLILLGLSGSVFGGSSTDCGPLQANFAGLLQVCEYLIEEYLSIARLTTDVYVGNSFVAYFNCNLDLTINTLASATSQSFGVSTEYVREIVTGSVSTPFTYPLGCIEAELLSFNSYIQNIIQTTLPEIEAGILQSPISETTPCPTVVQLQSQNVAFANGIASKEINAAITAASAFASLRLSDLYNIQNNLTHQVCGSKLVIESFAEFYNVDASIVSAFIQNQSTPVPPPLSCTKSLITSLVQGFDYNIAYIDHSLNNPSTPPTCEPFYSEFKAFKDVWFQYIDQLRFNTINISIQYPTLTPFFVADLLCELEITLMFAANATSFLSGVDSDLIYSFLSGQIIDPLPVPLDCVANDLDFMSNQINHLISNVIPGIQNVAVNSSSDTSTCNATYISLTGYVVQLVDLLNMKGYFVASSNALFTSTNLGDLFMESFTSILDCLPDLVGKYIGSALNANGTSVTAYVNGNRKSLPYPFRCAEILIDITDSLLNQALVNFVTDSPNNLVLPKIPKFRG